MGGLRFTDETCRVGKSVAPLSVEEDEEGGPAAVALMAAEGGEEGRNFGRDSPSMCTQCGGLLLLLPLLSLLLVGNGEGGRDSLATCT